MGRSPRISEGGFVYAVDCRGLGGKILLRNDEEYESFKGLIQESVEKLEPRLLAYCLQPKRWSAILVPRRDGDLSRWVGWLTSVHSMRRKAVSKGKAVGGLYERRFRSFPIQDNERLLEAIQFVESLGNSKKSPSVESYPWSSHHDRSQQKLPDWMASPPIAFPVDWLQRVQSPLSQEILDRLDNCMERGCPYGDAPWVQRTATRFKLESTLRPRGRPKKIVG
jgi:putative transposase